MRSLTTGNVELDIHTILAPSILNTFRSSIQPDSPLRGCDEELYSSATRGMYTRFLTVAHLDESTSEVNMVSDDRGAVLSRQKDVCTCQIRFLESKRWYPTPCSVVALGIWPRSTTYTLPRCRQDIDYTHAVQCTV